MNCCFDCVIQQLTFFFLKYCIFRSRIFFHGFPNSNFEQLNERTEVDNGQTVLLLNLEQIHLVILLISHFAHGRKL